MKKILFFTVMMLTATITRAQINEIAPGVAYGTEMKSIGFLLKGVYQFQDANYHLNGEFILFAPKTEKTSLKTTEINWWEVNANVTYHYELTDYITIYPLAGLNIMKYSEVTDTREPGSNRYDAEFNEYEIGLNFGGGFYYFIVDNFYAFWEGRYLVSDYRQVLVSVGVAYRFGLKQEK